MPYKLVACDFDDTLYSNKTHTISEKNREAIKRCREKGVVFALATGRNRRSITPFYKSLELDTPIIATGGAEVYDSNFNKLYTRYMKYEDVMALLTRAKELKVHAHIYLNDRFCYEKHAPIVDFYVKHTGLDGIVMPDLLELPPEKVQTPKLLMMGEPDEISRLQIQLSKEFPNLNVVKSLDRFVEFYDKGTSKGEALKFLLGHLGIAREECIAAGDTQIDISLLKAAGCSAAPANSMPDVLQVADIKLSDCDHDCIAELLYEHVFDK